MYINTLFLNLDCHKCFAFKIVSGRNYLDCFYIKYFCLAKQGFQISVVAIRNMLIRRISGIRFVVVMIMR